MENNNDNAWWKPALIFFGKTTGWIISPIILVLILNRFLAIPNFLFFILLGAGFLFTIFGIYKEIKNYQKSLK